jgi:signal transduction histidine kinase
MIDKAKMLEAITAAQNLFIGGDDPRLVFDHLLQLLLELTGSEYGYIGEVLLTDEGKPYLKTHAITNIAWSDETRRFFEENAPSGLEFYRLDSLFGWVMVHEEVLISNAPSEDPRACGLPPGHPELHAFLGIPFFADGDLIGTAGISNREGGYDEALVEALAPFTATCANILLANRARVARRHQQALREEFVSVVSHELRTPMNSIRGALDLLRATPRLLEDPQVKPLLELGQRGCQRMMRLLDDLLDAQRIDARTLSLQMEEHDLMAIIERSVSDLQPVLDKAELAVEVRCPPGLRMVVDRDRLCQVLGNLINNSTQAHPEKGRIEVVGRDVGDAVELEVTDDGPGIPEDERATIFEKFRQLESPGESVQKTLGLGLYIVRGIVESHGGTIEVESEPGEGARFKMVFPKGWSSAQAETSPSD